MVIELPTSLKPLNKNVIPLLTKDQLDYVEEYESIYAWVLNNKISYNAFRIIWNHFTKPEVTSSGPKKVDLDQILRLNNHNSNAFDQDWSPSPPDAIADSPPTEWDDPAAYEAYVNEWYADESNPSPGGNISDNGCSG